MGIREDAYLEAHKTIFEDVSYRLQRFASPVMGDGVRPLGNFSREEYRALREEYDRARSDLMNSYTVTRNLHMFNQHRHPERPWPALDAVVDAAEAA